MLHSPVPASRAASAQRMLSPPPVVPEATNITRRFSLHAPNGPPQVVRQDACSTPAQRTRFVAVSSTSTETPHTAKHDTCGIIKTSPAKMLRALSSEIPVNTCTPTVAAASVVPQAEIKEQYGLDHLKHLPKFRPPDFQGPLPIPESPVPTPLTLQSATSWSDWPSPDGIGNIAGSDVASDLARDRAKHDDSEGSLGGLCYSASDGEDCTATPGSSTPEKQSWQVDELCITKVVFPEAVLGAVLAPCAETQLCMRMARWAPLPEEVPTPWGFTSHTCPPHTLGVMPLSWTPVDQTLDVQDSPEIAWYLPVPESPEPTPPVVNVNLIASSTGAFSWGLTLHPDQPLSSQQSESDLCLGARGGSTGGTGEAMLDELAYSGGAPGEGHTHDLQEEDNMCMKTTVVHTAALKHLVVGECQSPSI